MIKISIEYSSGQNEIRTFSTKEQAEAFVETLNYWETDIWVGCENFFVEWSEKHRFGW